MKSSEEKSESNKFQLLLLVTVYKNMYQFNSTDIKCLVEKKYKAVYFTTSSGCLEWKPMKELTAIASHETA